MGGFLTTATSLPSSDHPRPHLLEVVCARNTQEQRLTATWGAHNGNQLACTGCTVCPQHFTTIAWRLMPRPQTRQQATLATPLRQQQTVIGPTIPHQRSTVAGGGLSRTPSVAWFRVVHVASRCTDAPRVPCSRSAVSLERSVRHRPGSRPLQQQTRASHSMLIFQIQSPNSLTK